MVEFMEKNDPDITAGMTDDEMTFRFREAIRIDNEIKRLKGTPIQGWDDSRKAPYIEYPDGHREYA